MVTCLLLLTGILITTLTITSGTGDLGFGGPLLIGLGRTSKQYYFIKIV